MPERCRPGQPHGQGPRGLVVTGLSVGRLRTPRVTDVSSVPVALGQKEHTVGVNTYLCRLELVIGKSSSSASSTVCWACGAPGHPHVPRWPAVAGGADCWGAGPDRCFTCVAPSAPSRRETLKRTVTGGQHRPRRSLRVHDSRLPGGQEMIRGGRGRPPEVTPLSQGHRAGTEQGWQQSFLVPLWGLGSAFPTLPPGTVGPGL